MADCDHTSVGILIFDQNKLVLVKRRNFPEAFAPVSGHGDGLPLETAAIKEAYEEAGIRVTRLQLVYSARFDNPCKRHGGTWHYWQVYKALDWNGTLRPGDDAISLRSCSPTDLVRLARKTLSVLREQSIPLARISAATQAVSNDFGWRLDPGLEPVWITILQQIGAMPYVKY